MSKNIFEALRENDLVSFKNDVFLPFMAEKTETEMAILRKELSEKVEFKFEDDEDDENEDDDSSDEDDKKDKDKKDKKSKENDQ